MSAPTRESETDGLKKCLRCSSIQMIPLNGSSLEKKSSKSSPTTEAQETWTDKRTNASSQASWTRSKTSLKKTQKTLSSPNVDKLTSLLSTQGTSRLMSPADEKSKTKAEDWSKKTSFHKEKDLLLWELSCTPSIAVTSWPLLLLSTSMETWCITKTSCIWFHQGNQDKEKVKTLQKWDLDRLKSRENIMKIKLLSKTSWENIMLVWLQLLLIA